MAKEQTTFWDAEHMKDTFDEYMIHCDDSNQLADIKGFCLYSKLPSSTFYNIVDNPNYIETIKYIYDSLQINLINKGYTASNSRFIEFMLRNRFRNDFKESSTVEHINQTILTDKQVNEQKLELISKLLLDNPELMRDVVNQNNVDNTKE